MHVNRVDAGRGLAWYGLGWQIFKASPGMWIGLVLVWALLSFLASMVPVIGLLVFSLLTPALMGGLLYAAREAAEERPIHISHLFVAFSDQRYWRPILTLGLVSLIVGIVAILVVVFAASSAAGEAIGKALGEAMVGAGTMPPGGATSGIDLSILLACLLAVLVALMAAMALFYSVPLVMFTATPPLVALKSSVHACLVNWAPLLIYGLVGALLGIAAAIPVMLGFLVLAPVSVCAGYASYRDVYSG